MAAMVLFKRQEVMTGRQSVVSRVGAGTDHVFQRVFVAARKVWSYANRKTFIMLAHWIAYQVLYHVRHVYVEVKSQALSTTHGKRLLDAVRGRGEVKTDGVSFYLRRISADHPGK